MITLPLSDVARWLHCRVADQDGRMLVALAGLPGAGKSTAAERIARDFNSHAPDASLVALGMDGFHLSKAELRRRHGDAGMARRGAPWTFDPDGLLDRLRQVRANDGPVAWPGFAHDIGDPVPGAQHVAPDVRVVLVEGLYLLLADGRWHDVAGSFDVRCYLDTPADVARERLIRRHMQAWRLDRAAATKRAESNDDLNAAIVASSRGAADVVIVD